MIHDYFSSIDTEEKAYWLGFLFADGHVASKGNQITLTQKDAAVPASFLRTIESTNSVNKNVCNYGTTYRALVRSPQMKADLITVGCVPAKSSILKAPMVDLGDLTRHFIRGYNDGDGGIYVKRRCLKMRGTLEFLKWVQSELPPGSIVYDYAPTAQLWITKNSVLQETINYLYEGATIYLPSKYEVAMMLS